MTEIFLLQIGNEHLLLGFLPEPLGLLLFGVLLIFIPVILRRILNDGDEAANREL